MKKFLQAAFKISLFQILFIATFTVLKYFLTTYEIIDKMKNAFLWVCFIAGAIFVLAIIVISILESRGQSFAEWKAQPNKSLLEKIIGGFASWGFAIPIILGYAVLVYIFAPTSVVMGLALYAGIVIRNCIDFFSKKKTMN